jgi:uncharacterized membrane protein YcaP (DUF421 family)
MSEWIVGSWPTVGYVALSTMLIYVSVVVGTRFSERRTLAEMTAYDFAAAVALGSIIGRTATAKSPSYVQGLAAVVALLLVHNVTSWGRYRWSWFEHLTDRAPIVVVRNGRPVPEGLRRAKITEADLETVLRRRGLSDLRGVRALVLEGKGAFSVIADDRDEAGRPDGPEADGSPTPSGPADQAAATAPER